MTDNNDREQFQEWAVTAGYPTDFVRGGIGCDGGPVYDDPRTHAAWWAWQDSRSAALEEAAKVVEDYEMPGLVADDHKDDELAQAAGEVLRWRLLSPLIAAIRNLSSSGSASVGGGVETRPRSTTT